jgi:hypothetical protein
VTSRRVCSACAIAGLVACAHVAALCFTEAAHPPRRETRPAIVGEALPLEPPHTHDEVNRSVRVELAEVGVGGAGTPNDDLPPGVNLVNDVSNRIARQHWERRHYQTVYRAGVIAPLVTDTSISGA